MNPFIRWSYGAFLGALLLACASCDRGVHRDPSASVPAATSNRDLRANARVGFFTPRGVPAELVSKTQFAMIGVATPEQVETSLAQAQGSVFKVNIDFGPLLAEVAKAASIKRTYLNARGETALKALPPVEVPKLRTFPEDQRLAELLAPYLAVMKRHEANVGTVFLADEPYLNGISKQEMERAGRVARAQFDAAGLASVKLGVIFASGMFDAQFARFMAGEAARYVERIDTSFSDNKNLLEPGDATQAATDFRAWVAAIKKSRLSTYDTAGNMYVEGGVPAGFEVFGFDFYLSTLLLDGLHENTLDWLAHHTNVESCKQFEERSVSSLRKELSFFHDGSATNGSPLKDKELLDAMFDCRMRATVEMLKAAIQGTGADVLMISESSSNGVLEFDALANAKTAQPAPMVEARLLDEVTRAERLYEAQRLDFKAGLMFFTYEDEYDNSIDLKIGGAVSMPRVLSSIFRLSSKG